jgi:serine/threonine-protein kinase
MPDFAIERGMTQQGKVEDPYPRPGEILEDKYEIQKVLGTGAMGAVVRATHILRQAPVALKFMSPRIMNRPGVVQRFLNEGVAASRIDSDHVVKVLDVSKLPSGVPYMVMEYLEGEDLADLIEREGTPGLSSVPRSVHFVLQMLRGLQVAHRVGIVHRDMKPANCFIVTKDGEPDFLKIVDFRISKIEQDDDELRLTQTHSALGTPLYMSPEQARNPRGVDPRSDLYSVTAILYEMMSGTTPFVPESGTFSELLMQLGTEEPKSLEVTCSGLPSGFWDAVYRGLVKKPDDRYQDAAQMAEALAPFADARSDHVLRQLLQRATSGMSRFPLPTGPATEVDEPRQPAAPASAVAGTLVMDEGAGARPPTKTPEIEIGDASVNASLLANAATVLPETQKSQDMPLPASAVVTHAAAQTGAAAVADTGQGTVRDAAAAPQSSSRAMIAGVVALLAAGGVVAALALGGDSDTAPDAAGDGSAAVDDTAAPVEPSSAPPAPTAENSDDSASAEPTTSSLPPQPTKPGPSPVASPAPPTDKKTPQPPSTAPAPIRTKPKHIGLEDD